jgi:Family of unknown function (DUF6496)
MCAHENAVRTPEFGVQADANGGRIADDVANTVWRLHDDYYPVSENPGPFHGVMEPLALHCGLTQITTELPQMASTSPRQRRITGRVMHEFKHGELKSGRAGKGGKVKSRRQAIAIALEEAGTSKYESNRQNRRNLRRTEAKEAKGRTAQQEREGKSHVGARGKRESSRAMGGREARKTTARGRKASRARARKSGGHTRQELYAKARRRHIEGRSKMSKRQLENALGLH